MQDNTAETRQQMGCGFEPRVEKPCDLWSHKSLRFDPEHCPVYTTSLPEVHDIALAVGSCGQGGLVSLPVLCGGASPPRTLVQGCQVLMGAQSEHMSWKTDPKNKDKA